MHALPVVDELQVDVEIGGLQQALDLLEVVAGLRLHAQLVALDLRLDRLGALVVYGKGVVAASVVRQ